ncbi:MAG: hypothetical protein NZL90_00905 [Aquificaceae bacterium]|nr:hypothetical protein [Aquificaceae bacterium]
MIDPEILIFSIVKMAEGVKGVIGDKGSKAVLRDSGRHAGPKMFENLMGHFPETLPREDAIARTCTLMQELGFAEQVFKQDKQVVFHNDAFTPAMEGDLANSPLIYFLMGLIEGFVQYLSKEKLTLEINDVQKGIISFKYS